jgi:chemotaxis signal transduction protein
VAEQRAAWLFDFGAGLRAAVGGQHLAEYLRAPEVVEVPLAPALARGVLVWRERLVPLLDLGLLAGNDDGRGESVGAIVLAYQQTPESPLEYGALALAAAPREIGVRDELACDLPAEPAFWGALAASCITYEGRPTPILRVRNIFTLALVAPDAPLRATPAAAISVAEPEIGANQTCAVNDAFVPCLEFVAPEEMPPTAVEPAGTAEASAPANGWTHVPEESTFGDVPMLRRATAEPQGMFSRSVLFYRRLRETVRRYRLPEPRRFWPRLAAGAATVLAVLLLWNFFGAPKETPVSDNESSRTRPVVNVAPAKITRAAVPAAPVQPPK